MSKKNKNKKQEYDNIFKRLIERQFKTVIPLLFPTLEPTDPEELTIEALLPRRRMDKVYRFNTPLGPIIFHLEVEMSSRGRGPTSRRMLVYHSILLEKYNQKDEGIPVITIVVYPIHGPAGEPHLLEAYGSEELLSFRYREMMLRTMDARAWTQAGAVPLYGFLPAMQGVSEELLNQAIDDMVHYYGDDEDHLRDELWCFKLLLNRVRPLPEEKLQNVLRRIHMYDPWLREDPLVQECVAEGEARGEARGEVKGEARGEARGEVKGMRTSIEMLVQTRFPGLAKLATQRVERLHDPVALQQVLVALIAAPDERDARSYLQAL